MKLTDYIANFITKRTKHAFVGNGGSVVHILDSLDKFNNSASASSSKDMFFSSSDSSISSTRSLNFCSRSSYREISSAR